MRARRTLGKVAAAGVLACLVALGPAGCGDDDGAGTDGAVSPDGAPPGDAGPGQDVAPLGDGGGQHDADAPDGGGGLDPCSGNPFTPTTPSSGQGTAPGDASADQLTALDYMNSFRNLMGLEPIDLDAALNQASQAHSDYCTADPSWCPGWHDEVPGHPGFTGESFWERCSAAGYTGQAAMEVMAPGVGPTASIDMWMDSVYHRSPFIAPEIHEAGYGGAASYVTMDFGCCGAYDQSLVTNYPVHGQTGVPTSWSGNEGPQPPAPPTGYPSGPVISVVFPSLSGLSITAHEIFDAACAPVGHVAGGADITPDPGFQTSFLRSSIVLYPNDPLASGQTYTVNVEYTRSGSPGHRTFTFTTQ